MLSLLAIGGAITTAPDMHRYVVDEHHWISDAQFSASIAIAQAAPGPNVLFVAVLGWNVAGPLGALATMAGTLLPSTALTLVATRWGAAPARHARRARLHDRPDAADDRPAASPPAGCWRGPYVDDGAHAIGAIALIVVSDRRDAAHPAQPDVAGRRSAPSSARSAGPEHRDPPAAISACRRCGRRRRRGRG